MDVSRTPLRVTSEHEMRIIPTPVFDAVSLASSVAILDTITSIADPLTIVSAFHSSTAVALATSVMHTVVTETVFVICQVMKRRFSADGLALREV